MSHVDAAYFLEVNEVVVYTWCADVASIYVAPPYGL